MHDHLSVQFRCAVNCDSWHVLEIHVVVKKIVISIHVSGMPLNRLDHEAALIIAAWRTAHAIQVAPSFLRPSLGVLSNGKCKDNWISDSVMWSAGHIQFLNINEKSAVYREIVLLRSVPQNIREVF
jgi:hypothetical protein